MKLENRIFDGIEYTLVDCYDWEEKECIYHFIGDESELFCTKDKNVYIPIKNKNVIDDIIDYYFLKQPEIYFSGIFPVQVLKLVGTRNIEKVSSDQRQEKIDEVIDKLSELKCVDNKGILAQRLENVEMYTADWNRPARAFYHPATNSMFFNKSDLNMEKSISSKRICLHEIIHAITGAISMFSKYMNKSGLIEGATENIVEKLYGKKTSQLQYEIIFNFSQETMYPYQVSLIRQMEYVLQTECDESILNGDNKFFDEFAEKYGKDTLRFLQHRANRLLHPERLKNEVEYFIETQDVILEAIFDKDFEGIEQLDDAKSYFKRLQSFELVRGKIQGETTFREFYEEKLRLVKQKLLEKEFSEENIQMLLDECQYQEMMFYPINTEEEKYNNYKRLAVTYVADEIGNNQNVSEQINDFQFLIAKKEGTEYFVITRGGEPIFMCMDRGYNDVIYSGKFGDKLVLPKDVSLVRESESLYINIADSEKILLEQVSVIQDFEVFQQEIEKKIEANKLEAMQMEEQYMIQMEEMKKVAQKQRLPIVNAMIKKIKEKIKGKNPQVQEIDSEDNNKGSK